MYNSCLEIFKTILMICKQEGVAGKVVDPRITPESMYFLNAFNIIT